jgi:AraC-like DNA-binding protein
VRENHLPKNDLLKNYISYISYSHTEEGKREFFVFPNPGAAIALHKKHAFINKEKNVFATVDTETSTEIIHTNRIDPVKVIDEGSRESFTIVFYPLGVNHFFHEPLSSLINAAGGEHSYIDIRSYRFEGFAEQVFNQTNREGQLDTIENFLLSRLNEKEIPLLKEALNLLVDFEQDLSISVVCRKIGTSPRNLSRLFQKHIALSPVEFRNIARFRYSLSRKVESTDKPLKEIGYESNYSDASYMIRMYKKYTGLNPSAFFDKVTIDSNYVFLSL